MITRDSESPRTIIRVAYSDLLAAFRLNVMTAEREGFPVTAARGQGYVNDIEAAYRRMIDEGIPFSITIGD